MKNTINKKGLTLVEIVVSLAIFGVISVVFLNVFLSSYLITIRAEDRTKAVGEASGQIEQALATTKSAVKSTSVAITYNASTSSIVSGEITNASITTDKNQTIEFEYFIPKE